MAKKTAAGEHVAINLAELQRRQDLESLRVYVEHACCFQPNHDPKTRAITMEELKKLARVWKLHGKYIYYSKLDLVNMIINFPPSHFRTSQFLEDAH